MKIFLDEIIKKSKDTIAKLIDDANSRTQNKLFENKKLDPKILNKADNSIQKRLLEDVEDVTGLEGLDLKQYYNDNNNPLTKSGFIPSTKYFSFNNYWEQSRQRLNLTREESEWLSKIWQPSNQFTTIPQCCDETIKLFIKCIHSFDIYLGQGHIKKYNSFRDLLAHLDKKAKKEEPKKWDAQNYSDRWTFYYTSYKSNEFLYFLFKISENVVEKLYKKEKKSNLDVHINNLNNISHTDFSSLISTIVNQQSPFIESPTNDTLVAICAYSSSYWKSEVESLKYDLVLGLNDTIRSKMKMLVDINVKNSTKYRLFFELSKMIAPYDKTQSLIYFLYYSKYARKRGLEKSTTFPMNTRKIIFGKDMDSYSKFTDILSNSTINFNVRSAENKVKKLFEPKIRKIILDKNEIKKVNKLHSTTVDKLNEILSDTLEISIEEINHKEETVVILPEKDSNSSELFDVNEVELLNQFLLFNNRLDNNSVSIYIKTKNLGFVSSYINNINEKFYLEYEDNIIEENEEGFAINEYYMNQLNILLQKHNG